MPGNLTPLIPTVVALAAATSVLPVPPYAKVYSVVPTVSVLVSPTVTPVPGTLVDTVGLVVPPGVVNGPSLTGRTASNTTPSYCSIIENGLPKAP